MNPFYIFDSNSLYFREFHALIELKNKKGYGTGMAFGAIKTLAYLMKKYRISTNNIILVEDRKPYWKYDLYPQYKSKRKKIDLPEKMSVPIQLKITRAVTDTLGFNVAHCDNQESDCVCASISKIMSKKRPVVIVSNDHDLLQCLDENVNVLLLNSKGEEKVTQNNFIKNKEIYPEDYWKVQTLGGCTTDKVPGMLNMGEKSALEVVKMNSWEKIIRNDCNLKFSSKRIKTAFIKGHSSWDYKKMEKLVRLQINLKPVITKNSFDKEKLRKLFTFLGFAQYLQRDNFNILCEVFGGKNGKDA